MSLLFLPGTSLAVDQSPVLASAIIRVAVLPVGPIVSLIRKLFHSSARRRDAQAQETTVERTSRVSSIQIEPAKIVVYQDQSVSFGAVGTDSQGNIAHGARFSWSSSDENKLQIADGHATINGFGLVWVTASTPTVSARVPVLIRPGARPVQTDSDWLLDQEQLKPDGTVSAGTGGIGSVFERLMDNLAPTAHAQASGGDGGDFAYDELWSEPRNLVGSPRNRVTDPSAIGTVLREGSNFEFSVPIESLSGRGVPLSLSLNYNSRIWSRHGSAVTFNAVNTWPYLGFTLSYGRIVTYTSGSNTKFILIDSDGTRHYLGSGPGGTTTTYQSNDGSHITYVGKSTTGGTLYYNNGVRMTVGVVSNRLLVTEIKDSNGNYVSISYANQTSYSCNTGYGFNWNQAISSITDTLGRVVIFNYDTCNNLISISGPGLGGSTTTLAQFDYTFSAISNSFSGLTVENRPTSGSAIELKHIYFPDTQTGYLFSYSAYGMIYNVSVRKQMSINGSGVISDGTEKRYVNFNYPTTASSLTDAPSFSQRTEYPAATSGGTAVYSYSSSSATGIISFTTTRPDSSTVIATRSDSAGVDFGLLTQFEVKNSSGISMAKSIVSYANDGGGQPQVASIINYDDAVTPNQTKVDFDYDTYGNTTNKREYGFQDSGSWKVRRRSRSVFKTDSAYLNAYLRNLVIEADLYDAQLDTNDGNDNLIAKTTYTFDNYSAMSGMENYGGAASPPGHDSSYGTSLTVRGNCTGETIYTDVTTPVSITWLKKVDIFGNVTQRQLACCNLETTTFAGNNDYALPEIVTKGPSGGPQLTSSASFDFNRSSLADTTDFNGMITTVTTRDAAFRPVLKTYPAGGYAAGATVSVSYSESTPSVSQSAGYDDGGTHKTVNASTVYDNLGRIIQQVDTNGAQVNTSYDSMGRVLSRTNPFPSGGTPSGSTTYTYDALSRVTAMTLSDGQVVQTIYNGTTVTVIDQVNRKTQRTTDGLGRLTAVFEQDASGTLTQSAIYSYNYLDKLTEVNQGGQYRKYKYDAIGDELFENIPEQTPTIPDGGVSNQWTSAYTYTTFGALSTKTDARGVVTTYTYDGLNRVTQVSYNTVSGITTAPTVTLVYDNDSTYGITSYGTLLRINVGSDFQERYILDASNRISSVIRTIGTRTYTTGYAYNQASQLTQLTYPSSRVISSSYDSTGRLISVAEPVIGQGSAPSYLRGISYSNIGLLSGDIVGGTAQSGGATGGVTEVFGYDTGRIQLTSQKAGTSSPYTNRMDLTYDYSAATGEMGAGSTAGNAGQLMAVSGTIGGLTETAAYTYDNLGRLLTSDQTSNGVSAQRRFYYDRWGNRKEEFDSTVGGNQRQSIALSQSGSAPTNRIQTVYPQRANVANVASGATASSSSRYSSDFPESGVIDGDRKGTNWGSSGGWKDATASSYPDWIQVSFSASKTINEIDVFGLQDNYTAPVVPTEDLTSTLYTLTDFQVQYWNGSSWQTVSGGSVTGNNKVWNKFTFSNITTDKIRVNITGSNGSGYCRVTEIEAYQATAGAVTYAYDSNGNVTDDGIHTYSFDSENRLVGVDGGATASYAYDSENRRYKKTIGSATTHYLWQGNQVLAEHNGSTGAVLTDYVYSAARMIAKISSGTTQYFLSDRLSPRLTLDNSGSILGRMAHLPFGEDFAESGTQEKHHFTGYDRDSESGRDYAINRQYVQETGRFDRPDPSSTGQPAVPDSWNRYSYVLNHPVNFTDPAGLLLASPDCYDLLIDGLFFGSIGECPFFWGSQFVDKRGGGGGKFVLPSRCSLEVKSKGDAPSNINVRAFEAHNHSPNPTMLGEGESEQMEADGSISKYWFFYFEVVVSLPKDDLDPNDWLPFQSGARQGSITFLVGGQYVRIPVIDIRPDDSPIREARDTSNPGLYLWVDLPYFGKVTTIANRDGSNVMSGPTKFVDFQYSFLFLLVNKKNPLKSCTGSLALKVDVTDGVHAHWK